LRLDVDALRSPGASLSGFIARHIEHPAPVKARSRISHWPPDRMVQWRLENLTPWKLKSWKFKDWD
jgi:hypothetical protein